MLLPLGEDVTTSSSEGHTSSINTRIAGGGQLADPPTAQVVVDSREFNSSLPGILHASGVKIIPITLTIGDYILTPDICVERKSVPDLIGSFNNGHLCVSTCKSSA